MTKGWLSRRKSCCGLRKSFFKSMWCVNKSCNKAINVARGRKQTKNQTRNVTQETHSNCAFVLKINFHECWNEEEKLCHSSTLELMSATKSKRKKFFLSIYRELFLLIFFFHCKNAFYNVFVSPLKETFLINLSIGKLTFISSNISKFILFHRLTL